MRCLSLKNAEIKRKIIDTTKMLLKENGNVTIKDIADRCFINIAAVNYHFGSKENLIEIVIGEILQEIKAHITMEMNQVLNKVSVADFLEEMVSYVYNFALDNAGILSYLFLTREQQLTSTNQLLDTFFADSEFTQLVYKNLKQKALTDNPKEVMAKYVMIFSSLAIPLFIQLVQHDDKVARIETFRDPEFKQFYFKQLLNLVD